MTFTCNLKTSEPLSVGIIAHTCEPIHANTRNWSLFQGQCENYYNGYNGIAKSVLMPTYIYLVNVYIYMLHRSLQVVSETAKILLMP